MGSCISSPEQQQQQEEQGLLDDTGEEEDEDNETIDRTGVPQTIINVPKHDSRPPPLAALPSPGPVDMRTVSYIYSEQGKKVMESIREAYDWKQIYQQPTLEFSYKTNLLFTSLEAHLTTLSSQNTHESRAECDSLIAELLALRRHWGTQLLPLSMRNAFVREKIEIIAGKPEKRYKVDCIQFFEPIVFYGNDPGNQEDLVKLFVFVVTDTEKEEVLIRYYLERSFLFDFYHVLCFFKGNTRGQLKPYGTQCPSYWMVREHMLQNARSHLESTEELKPIAATVFATPRNTGPVNI